jgi:flavin-dependent thymidylate synthase
MGTDITRWADEAMFEAAPIRKTNAGLIRPQVFLLNATPDPLGAIAAGFRMYGGKPTYSLDDVTDEERRWAWEESLKTHLKAPWEFVDMHFFIEAVSRAFTHQMVRQRTAVYAQESLRFAVKEGLAQEIPLPPSVLGDEIATAFWQQAISDIEKAYNALVNAGIPAEDARGLLPHATTTRLNYKTTYRGLIQHAGNRLCTQAQFEWRHVFLGIMESIRKHKTSDDVLNDGWQFEILGSPIAQTFTPVCYKAGRCVFMGDLDRQCTIRERVNEGRFEDIRPEEWMADPTAARR